MNFTDIRLRPRQWTKDEYLISTDPTLIPINSLNAAFGSDDVYWAKPLPQEVMKATLQNSLCFGMYEMDPHTNSDMDQNTTDVAPNSGTQAVGSKFIGIARCITDFTTFIYLTDVYIYPSHQGKGLGKWLVSCVQEIVDSMPYLRRSLAFTSNWKRSVPFYEKFMKMTVHESKRTKDGTDGEGVAVLMHIGKGHPSYTTQHETDSRE